LAPDQTSKNGRARIGVPVDSAENSVVSSPRKKKLPSIPVVWAQFSQAPKVKRPPERASSLTRSSPKRTLVPGLPKTPASANGVPTGLVVNSGGKWSPLVHHSRYSALAHTRPGGYGQDRQHGTAAGWQIAAGWQLAPGWQIAPVW
jgi:hypothetical protein